jgi:DNA-directed RNA polymerase subunit beta'
MVETRAPGAKAILDHDLKTRPVFINRAPSLHKHNIIAAYAVPVEGKSLRINPFIEAGANLDYDGDAMQIHVPATDKAVKEAQGMVLSKLLFSDRNRDALMVFPQHEAILGAYIATNKVEGSSVKKFKTAADAAKAYKDGHINANTSVQIGQ